MVDNLLYQRDKLEASDKTGMETEALKARYPKLRGGDPASPVQRG